MPHETIIMGATPSVCLVLPSFAVTRDVVYLKQLFPHQYKFQVELVTNSETVSLVAHDGKLTLMVVAQQRATKPSISNNNNDSNNNNGGLLLDAVTTLVLDESDIKAVIKQQQQQMTTSNGSSREFWNNNNSHGSSTTNGGSSLFVTATIGLPGGSILILVPPAMMGSRSGRQQLARQLNEYHSKNTNTTSPQQHGIPTNNNDGHHHQQIPPIVSKDSTMSVAGPNHVDDVDVDDPTITTTTSPTPTTTTIDYKLPSFPTLDMRLLQKDGQFQSNFPLNTRSGVPFETDLFRGKVLFLLRPSTDPAVEDPYWNERIFKHKQRRVIVQVQGKFKTKPNGILYAGGEISEPMKLGLLAKGLTKVLLKLLTSFYPTIHYSFGDDEESAHIVVPAYRFFERLVVTKPGEEPPPMGDDFDESPESIQARKSSKSTGDWNTTDTYSVSFYSMYLDLPSWSVVNIPMSNDMSLKTFWGKSLLNICLYDRVAPASVKKHLPQYNNYGFIIQVKHLGHGSSSSGGGGLSGSRRSKQQQQLLHVQTVDKVPNSDDEEENDHDDSREEEASSTEEAGNILDWTETPNRDREMMMDMPRSESQVFLVDDEENEDDVSVFDMNQFFDAEEYRDDNNLSDENHHLPGSVAVLSHEPELLKSVDTLCPAWVEMLVHRGNYARTYALNLDGNQIVFRKAHMVLDLFGSEGPPNDNICSPRMSSAEQIRRHLGQLLSGCVVNKNNDDNNDTNDQPLAKLQAMSTLFDDQFLRRKKPSSSETTKIQASCFVARALSDHHWIEEWATVTERGVNFYHPDRKKANHRVGIQSILKVNRLETGKAPCFPHYFFLSVETLGRTNYMMFASQDERDEFFKTISKLAKLTPSVVDSMETASDGNASTALLELQNPKDEFLHKSSLWDYKHRRVLNCRRFSFRARDKSSQHNPLTLAEDALRKALDPRNESDDDILIAFLDSAAKLKEANVYDLSEEQRLAFFLNVYHIMVMHAYLVLGTPGSSFQWISYFNSISYQCSDDIFSLAELEHCIIRASMSFPAQFLSRFVLPNSTYDFALTKSDYRINFALNCGSRSNPICVPVYKAHQLTQQLDDVSRLYLTSAVKVKKRSSRDVEVFLPRICLWFSNDFGPKSEDILKKVTRFLSQDIRDFLDSCNSGKRGRCNVSVKFSSYSFECRKLVLTPEAG